MVELRKIDPSTKQDARFQISITTVFRLDRVGTCCSCRCIFRAGGKYRYIIL